MSWIQHPVTLEGQKVKLVPLEGSHFPALIQIAANADIWTHLPFDGSDRDAMLGELQSAMMRRMAGEHYPFTIIDKATGNIIGSTRLFEIFEQHKKLEIGWTWNNPAYWGTGHNNECKYLMLTYCFETLHTQRVQLKTRNTNLRSRAAIEKIGAKFEGILRKDRLSRTGMQLDTYMYSITDDEWPEVKKRLEERMKELNPTQA